MPSVVVWRKYLTKNITIALEVNADNTKYMVMSRDQTAGRSQSIQIDRNTLKLWKNSNIWGQI